MERPMAQNRKTGLPPSHTVPKGRFKSRNRKAILILAGLVFLALLLGVFLSSGREDVERDALEGRPAPTQSQ